MVATVSLPDRPATRIERVVSRSAGCTVGAPAVFFLVIWLSLLVFGRSTLLQDPGTFWHLVLGERLLARGELTYRDSFTFTFDGQSWLSLQWLGEVAMAAAFRTGDWDTLLLLTVTILAATYAWLAARLMRSGLHWLPTAVLVAVVIAASSHHFHARPHVATIAFLGITMAWLCDVESGRASVYRLAWLVPLFVLWTNVHGGVLGGMVTVAAAVQAWIWCWLLKRGGPLRGWRDLLVLLPIFLAMLLSGNVNPYGPAMPEAWLKIMGMPLPDLIQEHRPLSLLRPEGWMMAALAAAYGLLLWDAWRRPVAESGGRRVVAWLLPLLWLVFAVERVRHAPLFAIVTAVVIADLLPHTRFAWWLAKWELFSFRGEKTTITRRASEGEAASNVAASPSLARRVAVWRQGWILLAICLVFVASAMQFLRVPVPVLGSGWARHDPRRWPLELLPELKALEAEQPGARVFNTLDFGGFVSFHAPRLKTFIDDRCELFGGEFLADYAAAEAGHPERIDDWAAHYGFDAALVRSDTPFDRYLRSAPGWMVVRQSTAATLYRKNLTLGGVPRFETE